MTTQTTPADPLDIDRCAFSDRGVRCQEKGSMSPTTYGKGPWFCRQHAWVFLNDRLKSEPSSV